MARRVGCHACGEERLLEDPRRWLLESRADVCHSSVPPTTGLSNSPTPCFPLSRDTAYHYKLAHVRSLDPASQSAQSAALDTIATAVSNPAVLDFDPLFKLDAVLATKSHPLFALLRIFLSGGLDDLRAWQRAHADVSSKFGASPLPLVHTPFRVTNRYQHTGWVNKIGLDSAQLECKIRLLALADLGFQNIGQDLSYAQVAATLQVAPTEVERWVIDGSSAPPLSTSY